MSKKTVAISVVLVICFVLEAFVIFNRRKSVRSISVNLSNLTYKDSSIYKDLKVYSIDDFESFLSDYKSDNLPSVYVTEFVFDGVGMYKTYDLDDFIDDGNDASVKVLSTKAVNINTTGKVVLSGNLKGMILVNTNDISGDIDIVLDSVNIDSDSKKIPAVYVYNKDINYTDHKVTISALEGTKNYIDGGKFKKISLVGSDELSNYSSKYTGETSEWYSSYTNYYGVYTSNQIDDIIFAKVTASSDDLKDGDPYYFYKGAGAISSDIDLYFNGSGYLEVTSSKEGIESKGNLVFSGGIGDYVVNAYDDCLNTTTKNGDNVRNDMVIDVNSLTAIVEMDADEGDALDSNGTLTINGGTIIALSHPGADAGLDSSNGTYINGGTIIATGDMYDEIKSDSKQKFVALSFMDKVNADDIITFTDGDNVIFSYKTDRAYSNLVYSSNKLVDGDYSLYKNGTVVGESVFGFYNSVDSFSDGISLGYTQTGMNFGGGFNGMPGDRPDMNNQDRYNKSDIPNKMDEANRPERPNDIGSFDGDIMTPPDLNSNPFIDFESSNKVFSVSGISNLFSGIVTYSVE